EMDPSLQAKLLRFLQDHSFYRVGGKERIEVDVRIISATNRDPLQAIADGVLREDLYYRLNVVQLPIPSLRERAQDIPELAESFLARFAGEHNKRFETIDDEALAVLCAHQWPGNIRELFNSIQQAIVLNDGDALKAEMLPETVRKAVENAAKAEVQSQAKQEDDEIVPFEIVERDAIENALRVMKGNVAKASAALHLSQATFYRKIRDYDLDMKSFKKKG
ncbi:sigma 54-interacting transcriptional regulator, partial [bacterium]|nr:sigma 54-interacting transcriptional regulator [bacterium]